jgi:hypothetical protein
MSLLNTMNTTSKNLAYTLGVGLLASSGALSPLAFAAWLAQPCVAGLIFAKSLTKKERLAHALAGAGLGFLAISVGTVAGTGVYFALNKEAVSSELRTKHFNKMLALPTDGRFQEKSIRQIELLQGGNWEHFITPAQTQQLGDKIAELKEGIKAREQLRRQTRIQEELAKAKEAKAEEEKRKADEAKKSRERVNFLIKWIAGQKAQGSTNYQVRNLLMDPPFSIGLPGTTDEDKEQALDEAYGIPSGPSSPIKVIGKNSANENPACREIRQLLAEYQQRAKTNRLDKATINAIWYEKQRNEAKRELGCDL